MELKQVKELMTLMKKEGVKKVVIKEKTGTEIHIEREEAHPPALAALAMPSLHTGAMLPSFTHHTPPPIKEVSAVTSVANEASAGTSVPSPMVGTYYAAPSPQDPPFIKVGDKVTEGTVVCIIEAMKVMNEVKAGVSGTVAEILVKNGQAVEFGTKLIRIV